MGARACIHGHIAAPRTSTVMPTAHTHVEAAVPPVSHNIEAEQALLGAMLIDNKAHNRVSDFLLSEHFSDPVHARIYEVAATFIGSGRLATPITLRTFFGAADQSPLPT